MAKEKLVVINKADITNNCPECFNQELELTFYQKHRYGKLFHKTTDDITQDITCKTCNSTIYPINWTEDIERVFEYYTKMTKPEKKSLKYTPLFYGLLVFLVGLIGLGIYAYKEGLFLID